MSDAGRKIMDGLQDAIDGNLAAVTIEGQRWVRQGADEPTIIPTGEVAIATCDGQTGLVLLIPGDTPDNEPMSRLAVFLSGVFVRAHAASTFIDEQLDWMNTERADGFPDFPAGNGETEV